MPRTYRGGNFYALFFSSVAIGMISLFTFPIMTVILEPLITKSKLNLIDLMLASFALVGVYFLVPSFDLENRITQGILLGLLSALAYSLRNLTLKLHVKDHSGVTLMLWQLMGLSILLSPILFFGEIGMNLEAIMADWIPLLILGILTTAAGHTLMVYSLKKFSVSTVSILSSMMPLIGIGWGMIFLQEMPDGNVFIGGCLIGVAVIGESIKIS